MHTPLRSPAFTAGGALLLAISVLTFALTGSASDAAAASVHRDSPCGAPSLTRTIVEPPNVDVSALPLNAGGEHELILAVHRAGAQFCYRYRWNGAAQTVAPVLRVHRGEHFALRVVNDIASPSAGERASSRDITPCMPMAMPPAPVHHYTGYLNHTIDDRFFKMPPLDTNFHLHGFIGPASEEDIFVSTLSTPMHACEYHVTIPRSQPPGTYFYHPHSHGSSEVQVAGGLSGAWIVEPDTPQIARAAEHVLLLKYRLPFTVDNLFVPDDSAFGPVGAAHERALRPAMPVAYDPFNPPPWPLAFPMKAGGVMEDRTGCNGLDSETTVAVNGSPAVALLNVRAEQTQLLRIVNATSDSPKALELHDATGHVVPMQVVARDGVPVSGNMTKPLSGYIAMNRVMLPPFGRVDALVRLSSGQTLTLASEHFCGGSDAFYEMHHTLMRITGTAPSEPGTANLVSSPLRAADTPAAKLLAFARANTALIHRRAITFTEYAFPRRGKIPAHSAYYITDTTNRRFRERPFWPSYQPGGTVPYKADVVVKAGTIEEWYLINATMEAHAFHIHQMSFVDESPPAGMPLTQDTIFVPVGGLLPNRQDPNYPLVRPSITKVLMDFRHVQRGTFVFHCHMLFHEDRGMMAVIRVE